MSNESDELKSLRAENARLIALLESHDIDWRQDPMPITPSASPESEPSSLSTAEKVALFRRLFRGRTDVHPVRWESATTGKSGYAPAYANEWRPGICEKPRIKCADCGNRALNLHRMRSFTAILPARRQLASTLSCPTTPATFSPSTLTRPNGARTPKPLCNPVVSWMCPLHWRYRARATVRTLGFSSQLRCRREMPGVWVQRSSVTPAAAHDSSA